MFYLNSRSRALSKLRILARGAGVILVFALNLTVPRVHPLADQQSFLGCGRAFRLCCDFEQFFAKIGGSPRGSGFLVLPSAVKAGRIDGYGVPANMHRSLLRDGRAI
jgi:hypothetical protein